jgi:hypothetical protein
MPRRCWRCSPSGGVSHINNLLWPIYLVGLAALVAAILVPGWLLRQLGRPTSPADLSHWRRVALWMVIGLMIAPLASAFFTAELYTARLTHLLVQVLLVTGLGCGCTWYLLKRVPGRFAAPVFVALLALYLGSQILNTAEGLNRNNGDLKKDLQHGVPEVMSYLARQPDVRSAHFPLLHQGYIYHLCFTPVHPTNLNYAELSPPPAEPGERWRYVDVKRVGNYYFNEMLDRPEISKTATLRHQVRDKDQIWYDLYERQGDWFVIRLRLGFKLRRHS